jgi:hypothetical protein
MGEGVGGGVKSYSPLPFIPSHRGRGVFWGHFLCKRWRRDEDGSEKKVAVEPFLFDLHISFDNPMGS